MDDLKKRIPGIYRLKFDLKSKGILTATRVADYPVRNVTGMAFSPNGRKLIVRNYLNAHFYERQPDQTWEQVFQSQKPRRIVLPVQRQGEAICFTPDSQAVIVTSETKRQPIWQILIAD